MGRENSVGETTREDEIEFGSVVDDEPDEGERLRRLAYLAYLYLNLVGCPRCRLPRAEGLVCPCGYDGTEDGP